MEDSTSFAGFSGRMDLRQSPINDSGNKVSYSITSIISALVSAILEWMLMFMIFVDSSFAYLVTRFARRCHLQIPCLLCSRLDHFLGNERDGFYWDLICHNHKSKISSLVLCQLHKNLVDVHRTCDSCIFSFSAGNKFNAEAYRLLVGKFGAEPDDSIALPPDEKSRKCLCCNEQWISRASIQNLFQGKSTDTEGADRDASSSITSKYNEVHEITKESSRLGPSQNKDTDHLPHVEYSQIKVTSDTESEGPFSDNESGAAIVREIETSGQDSVAKSDFTEPQITALDDCPTEKLIHLAFPVKSSLSESEDHTYSHHDVESEASVRHGLEEVHWQQADHDDDASKPSELTSSPVVHPSSNANEALNVQSKKTNAASTPELEKEAPVEIGEASNLGRDSEDTTEMWKEVNMDSQETFGVASDSMQVNETHLELKPNKTDTGSQMTESLDLGDAYKLALGSSSRQLSGRFLEQQRSMTDSTRLSEDLKLLLSQISAARGFDLSNDMSPKVSVSSEDSKAMDPSVAIGMQLFQRRISLERNESNLSIDGSIVSEIDGESEVERLKRQVEHDKKILGALYKELEEERNASAIATNQTMAMIARLQEEKAAFHMEALQCLRMMEEQAEYDSEALQKANEMLMEKEKLIQDFEVELDMYRNQSGDAPLSNDFIKPRTESEADELKDIVKRIDVETKMLDGDNAVRISLHQFEDEKQYILECLKNLEEKLSKFNRLEMYADIKDGSYSPDELLEASSSDQDFMGVSNENGRTEKSHMQRDILSLNESHNDVYGEEKFMSNKHMSKDAEFFVLRREFSIMNNRLGALEAEQNVIECSIDALNKGSEGFEFIREIASRLQELHSAHIIKRNEDLT